AWFDFTITSGITGGSDDWNVSAWNREEDGIIPYTTELIGNYPNPFNAQTTIVFNLYSDSHVDLNVYNILGEKIETLLNSEQNAGRHSVNWNAESYSSGIYFYKLLTGESVVSKRMVLLK
ncbi:MAG: T9SS type A sorting domain-containing protein, partial [candidate division Zixibacteria bacterium]|nr:T9SS type A sorting domain-containing protein [candidate division Zixibacteria bacterium]